MHIQSWLENLIEGDYLRDPGVDGKLTKFERNMMYGCGLN
jgi:hypothetical protein